MLLPLFDPANTAPLDFAEDDPSQIVEPLDTALAVARADPENPVCLGGGSKNRVTFMSDENANKSARTPPRCPSCAQPMRFVRKTLRFHGLPELYTFECRTCDVSFTQEVDAAVS